MMHMREAKESATGRPRRAWYRRPRVWIAWIGLLGVLFVVFYFFLLTPLATYYLQRAIGQAGSVRIRFIGEKAGLFPLTYTAREFWVGKRVPPNFALGGGDPDENEGSPDWERPVLTAESIRVTLEAKPLLSGELVGDIFLEEPLYYRPILVGNLTDSSEDSPEEEEREKEEEESEPLASEEEPNVGDALREAIPLDLQRFAARDGRMWFPFRIAGKKDIDFEIREVQLVIENFHTRSWLGHDMPTIATARALMGADGELSVFATADLLSERVNFAGQLLIENFDLTDINELVEAISGIEIERGQLHFAVAMRVSEGEIEGGAKVFLENGEIGPAGDGALAQLKAALADASVQLLSDRVPGRNAMGAVIPIRGRIIDPQIQLVPAVLSVLRNAFVEGLVLGLGGLPPETAPRKMGVLEQTEEALTAKQGPPRAQPTEKDEDR